MKMRLIRLCAFVVCISFISAELTTKERIELHKAWLEKRATLKSLQLSNMTTSAVFMPSRKFYSDVNKFRKYDVRKNEVISIENKDNEKQEDITILPKMENQNDKVSSVSRTPTTTTLPTTTTTTTTATSTYIFTTLTTTPTPRTTEPLTKSTIETTLGTTPMHRVEYVTENLVSLLPKEILKNNSTELRQHSKSLFSGRRKYEVHENHRNTFRKRQHERNSMWGQWQPWTNCSRLCGGGVMSQTRNCLSRFSRGTKLSTDCIGLHKRYRICNEQSCPDPDIDFRENQCAQYNNQTFKGKKYEWEAYIKEDAECELNCKPIGMSYFATLNEKVIDGTPCTRPADFLKRNYVGKAICVDGICKAVHSSGIITGAFMNNGAVRCGHLICRPVSGLYTKDPLPKGYVHVATIPIGASNISITELKNSMNLLALKYSNQNFIINGDYSVSLSGVYEAAGTVFDYRRIDGLTNGSTQGYRKVEGVTEWITCTGPITEPVHLMVLVQDKNPGIKYEYLLPINANGVEKPEDYSYEVTSSETEPPPTTAGDSPAKHTLKSGSSPQPSTITANRYGERKRRRFFWKVVGFTTCSKTCGGGIQSPVTRCVRENPIRYFKPKRCAHLPKPLLNENVMRCNTQPCPAYWKIGEWGECSCQYNEAAYQEREIKCVQEISPAMVIQVPIVACAEEKPSNRQTCECPLRQQDYQHRFTTNGITSIKNRLYGVSKMPMVIYGNSSISKRTRPADLSKNGIWLTSDWNQQCSVECGDGIQYRSIFCDRSPPKTDRCEPRFTPDTTRQCTVSNQCDSGDWFIGTWSQCMGDCFNLSQTRFVYCILHGEIVDESKCNPSNKPITIQACSMSDVLYCKPRWHYSDWSECTKICGDGTQRRTVKCFEPMDGELKPSDRCRYAERLPGSRPCSNTCNPTTQAPADIIQNDITPECKDELPDCHLVIQEHLCQFVYFKENCCGTCRAHLG